MSDGATPRADVDLDDLLLRTSRTFALAIPRLPDPLRTEVTVAYLLLRIADTLEDASRWSRERRIEALSQFVSLLEQRERGARVATVAREWCDDAVSTHEGDRELLATSGAVFDALESLRPAAREQVRAHVVRTADLMGAYVARSTPGSGLELGDLTELRVYCYAVAGLVGKLLTELFLVDARQLKPVARALRERACRFGEALQLVNILKDRDADAEAGRRFLPVSADPHDVFRLAGDDLTIAGEYVRLLQSASAPRGVVAFTALPVLLADAALREVQEHGPGSKVSRDEVMGVVTTMEQRLDAGRELFASRSANAA